MEFNASTFVLEIINFLILIWILQRLFYKPLLAMIGKRRQHIDTSLADAKKLHQEAEQLRSLYENRQKLWEQDKQKALAALQQQIETQRSEQMSKLRAELEQERQKSAVAQSRKQQELQLQAEKQALINGARFAALLLQQAAGPELEARLFSMLIERVDALPESGRLGLQTPEAKKSLVLKVTSAYPLASELRQQLEQKLNSFFGKSAAFQYFQDADLIAGIRIDIGAWVLHANLKHELASFAELAYESE